MGTNQHNTHQDRPPSDEGIELSIVMPCYNEEGVLPLSIPPLLDLCRELNLRYEMILVNNGSWDSTPQVIDSFISSGYPVRRVDVAVNQGYGWGVICGLKEATGRYIAYMSSDGQIHSEDVIRTYRAIQGTDRGVMAKAQRINRADGWLRKFISKVYNLLLLTMFRGITTDINGAPKIFHKEDLQVLKPTSKDWFIDSELMLKAQVLGLDVIEVPVTFYKRESGASAVRLLSTSLEFLRNMVRFRWGTDIKGWLAEGQLRPAKSRKLPKGRGKKQWQR
jgi:glycosyltransferase involved in cell wall biosynthesis